MADLLLAGGTVLTSEGPAPVDVRVASGEITAVGRNLDAAGAELLDCSGAWVGPGLVDLHTHLREPGQEWKEDVDSGTRAAAAGGYTALVAMPNTDPPIDAGHLARFVADRARAAGRCEVVAAGTLSRARAGEKLAHFDELWAAGVRLFTDDGDSVADAGLLRRAMEYVAELGGVVAQHAEDPGLVRGGHMHEGEVSSRLGMAGRPAAAEAIALARDLELARLTGARYHLLHATTEAALRLIAGAKDDGLRVTAEVTPHHLFFDHTAVAGTDPAFKVNPPLRTKDDVRALREALRTGLVDCVATDHAPHADHEKDVPFEEAPPGMIGLETAAAAVQTAVGLGAADFYERLSAAPARIGGLAAHGRPVAAGNPAHLCVFDPAAEWAPDHFESRSQNSPFRGVRLIGRPRYTIYAGGVTYADGKVQA